MSIHTKIAELRFAVIGELLKSPPDEGEIGNEIEKLSSRFWICPRTEQKVKFSFPTIERWYYQAKGSENPFEALRLKKRSDDGQISVFSEEMLKFLEQQYVDHPKWTVKLHHRNFVAWGGPKFTNLPCYGSTKRLFHSRGWERAKRASVQEKKSYEMMFAGALWHLDFHHARRMILLPDGRRVVPNCLAIMDDCTRLCCHIQWFLHETTECLVHGFIQALLKRGLPRALMSDNGSAMKSDEFTQGLKRLGIMHELTLPYSPYQNGKQESFWGTLEGQIMAMLEGEKDLTLERLNRLTGIWAEQEYNQAVHSQIKQSPLDKWMTSEKVTRPCLKLDEMRLFFRREVKRKVRRSDKTFSLEGTRFEIDRPVYQCQNKVTLHYATWDLSRVDIVDPKTQKILAPVYPINLQVNSNKRRRALPLVEVTEEQAPPALLKEMIENHAAAGEPAVYIPLEEKL